MSSHAAHRHLGNRRAVAPHAIVHRSGAKTNAGRVHPHATRAVAQFRAEDSRRRSWDDANTRYFDEWPARHEALLDARRRNRSCDRGPTRDAEVREIGRRARCAKWIEQSFLFRAIGALHSSAKDDAARTRRGLAKVARERCRRGAAIAFVGVGPLEHRVAPRGRGFTTEARHDASLSLIETVAGALFRR